MGYIGPHWINTGTCSDAYHPLKVIAVVAFAAQRNEDREGELIAYGRVQNFSPESVYVEIQLLLDDELIDAEQVEIAPDDMYSASFELTDDVDRSVLELRIVADGPVTSTLLRVATLPVRRVGRVSQRQAVCSGSHDQIQF